MNALPQTGTTTLLQVLSPHLNDAAINDLFPRKRGRGRRSLFRPAQLFRVLLLDLLTPVHSFNLLVQLLPEHRSWRDFARLPNKRVLPAATHSFKKKIPVLTQRTVRPSGRAPSRAGRADGTLATRSTRCGYGCRDTRLRFCSFPS
jgi:hypothetical protein